MIGPLLSLDRSILHQLETVLGLEDAYNILEVAIVDAENQRRLNKERERAEF